MRKGPVAAIGNGSSTQKVAIVLVGLLVLGLIAVFSSSSSPGKSEQQQEDEWENQMLVHAAGFDTAIDDGNREVARFAPGSHDAMMAAGKILKDIDRRCQSIRDMSPPHRYEDVHQGISTFCGRVQEPFHTVGGNPLVMLVGARVLSTSLRKFIPMMRAERLAAASSQQPSNQERPNTGKTLEVTKAFKQALAGQETSTVLQPAEDSSKERKEEERTRSQSRTDEGNRTPEERWKKEQAAREAKEERESTERKTANQTPPSRVSVPPPAPSGLGPKTGSISRPESTPVSPQEESKLRLERLVSESKKPDPLPQAVQVARELGAMLKDAEPAGNGAVLVAEIMRNLAGRATGNLANTETLLSVCEESGISSDVLQPLLTQAVDLAVKGRQWSSVPVDPQKWSWKSKLDNSTARSIFDGGQLSLDSSVTQTQFLLGNAKFDPSKLLSGMRGIRMSVEPREIPGAFEAVIYTNIREEGRRFAVARVFRDKVQLNRDDTPGGLSVGALPTPLVLGREYKLELIHSDSFLYVKLGDRVVVRGNVALSKECTVGVMLHQGIAKFKRVEVLK